MKRKRRTYRTLLDRLVDFFLGMLLSGGIYWGSSVLLYFLRGLGSSSDGSDMIYARGFSYVVLLIGIGVIGLLVYLWRNYSWAAFGLITGLIGFPLLIGWLTAPKQTFTL